MKVVLSTRAVYPVNGIGGMEHFVFFLAKYLQLQGVEVEVITAFNPSFQLKNNHYKGVPIYTLPVIFPLSSAVRWFFQYQMYAKEISRYLKDKQFDILHAFGFTALNYLKMRDRKPVVLQQFANECFKDHRVLLKVWNNIMWYKKNYRAMHKAERIASEGPEQTKEISRLFRVPESKIYEISDGIEYDKISKFCSSDPMVQRIALNIQREEMIFITVSRLSSNKRIHWIIEAFYRFQKEQKNSQLIIVGAGPQKKRLMQLIHFFKLTDKIKCFENISDERLFSLLSLSDIYINASAQQGLLISVLNAMGAGLPVVSVDSQEGLVRDFVTGLKVQASIKGLTEGMFSLAQSDKLHSMGENAKTLARDHDWNIIAKKAIECYQQLLIGKK